MGRGLHHVVPTRVTQVVVRTTQTHMSWASEVLSSTPITSDSNVILGRAPFSLASLFGLLGDISPRRWSGAAGRVVFVNRVQEAA